MEDVISRTVKLDENGKALYLEKIPKPAVGRNKWLERVLPIIEQRARAGFYLRKAKRKVGL